MVYAKEFTVFVADIVVDFRIKNTFKCHYRGNTDTLLGNTFAGFFRSRFVFIINYALRSGHVLLCVHMYIAQCTLCA